MSVIEKEAVVEPTTKTDKPSQLLELAAEYIERNGWIRGAELFYPEDRTASSEMAACVAVTISHAAFGPSLHFATVVINEAKSRLVQHLVEHYGVKLAHFPSGSIAESRTIFRWNDAPERTAEEVCRVLREVAAKSDGSRFLD